MCNYVFPLSGPIGQVCAQSFTRDQRGHAGHWTDSGGECCEDCVFSRRESAQCDVQMVHKWRNFERCRFERTGKVDDNLHCFRVPNVHVSLRTFSQEIFNVSRQYQNATVKCQAQNIVGADSDVRTLNVICMIHCKWKWSRTIY